MKNNYGVFGQHFLVRAVMSLVLMAGLFCGSQSRGQDDAASSPPSNESAGEASQEAEVAAIRAQSQAFVAAFNDHDAEAIAALWTTGGEYVDDVGHRVTGRDALQQAYANLFEERPNVKLKVMIDSIRLLSDTAAVEEGRAIINPPAAGAPGFSKYNAVHVKVDGKWLMASVRDWHVETPSTYENIADLDWLIGQWIAEHNGVTVESTCRWIANKSFVERRYTVTGVDGSQKSGVQIIGWNAEGGHVQSWNFSPDGGHAVGVWSPQEDGWRAEMLGTTGDGTLTSAVNLLSRLDDGAYVWQSVERQADGVALPDTDEVVLKRQSTDP